MYNSHWQKKKLFEWHALTQKLSAVTRNLLIDILNCSNKKYGLMNKVNFPVKRWMIAFTPSAKTDLFKTVNYSSIAI